MSATPDEPENVPNDPEVVIEPLSSEEVTELEAVVEETPDAEIVVADSDVADRDLAPEAADGKREIVRIAGRAAVVVLAAYLLRPDRKRTTTFKTKVTLKQPDGATVTKEITETHIDQLTNAAPGKVVDRLMALLEIKR